MPKIENWSRDTSAERQSDYYDLIWKNDELYGLNNDTFLKVGVMQQSSGDWIVHYDEDVIDAGGGGRTLPSDEERKFDSKEEARAYAVTWMNNHENGLKKPKVRDDRYKEVSSLEEARSVRDMMGTSKEEGHANMIFLEMEEVDDGYIVYYEVEAPEDMKEMDLEIDEDDVGLRDSVDESHVGMVF